MWERVACVIVFSVVRRGCGPRRDCSSSARSFSCHSASSHIRSSMRADRSEGLAAGAVEAVAPFAADVDEAGLDERAELQRDGAERDVRHRGVDVAGRALVAPDQAQDFAPAREAIAVRAAASVMRLV